VLRTVASGCAASFCPEPTPGRPGSAPAAAATPGRGRPAAHPGTTPRATLAAATAAASTPAPSQPARPTPSPSRPSSTRPTPSPPASTPPAPPPPVNVSYTLVQHWPGGFQGEFTIVNNSAAAINGWQLSAVLPGDRIDTVWDASYHTSGDTLLLYPPSYQVTIPAGGTLTENFTANGNSTSPAGCTFNGIAGC
jgi:cellulase/cellobiase CelA1